MNKILNNHKFELTISGVFKGAWKACFNNLGPCIVISLILVGFFVADFLSRALLKKGADISDLENWSLFESLEPSEITPLYIGVSILIFLVSTLAYVLVSNFTLTVMSKEKASFSAFLPKKHKLKKAYLAYLLWLVLPFVIILIPTDPDSAISLMPAVLIIVLIYPLIRYAFAWFVILDKDTSVADGFNKSKELTEGVALQLLLITIVVAVCAVLLSVVTLGLGLLIIFGFTELAHAYAYKALQQRAK